MKFDRDSEAILRFLEDNPQDADAKRCLADCLKDEWKDEVLAFGVGWLVGKGVWLTEDESAGRNARFVIDVGRDFGIDRRPFNGPVTAATVRGVLRAFAAYLWEFREWVADQLLSESPLPKPSRKKVPPAAIPPSWPAADDFTPWGPPGWPAADDFTPWGPPGWPRPPRRPPSWDEVRWGVDRPTWRKLMAGEELED